MDAVGNTWAIVLAGGEGSRLHSLTTTALGVAIPKQFCSLRGGDSLLHDALKRAVQELSMRPNQVVLMGILPEEADPDLGYIVPGSRDGAVSTVDRFLEKPDASLARSMLDQGALWNTFIVTAKGAALLQMFIQRFAHVVNGMRKVVI